MKYLSLLSCLSAMLLVTDIQSHEFLYTPSTPITLWKGVDNLNHPVSTKNEEAQHFFNQGLTLAYAFNHEAAYWSFQKAAELDPNLAMAYWGMALVLGQNINTDVDLIREKKAYGHAQKAIELSTNATDNEKAYIKALSARYSNDPNPNLKQLAIDYNAAMAVVVNQYPYDIDAKTLYAESGLDLNPWHQWTSEGDPLKGTLELVSVLEEALKWDPNHLGANHYYIHAVEASKNPERALPSADRLRKMLPNSGHILHMPSHIYMLVGDYQAAVESNLEAIKVDQAFIDKYGIEGIYPIHYMTHNMYFLSRAYSMEGRYEDAIKTAQKLRDFYTPHYARMPELEYYEPSVMFVMLRFKKWKEVLDLSRPPESMIVSNILWHFGRALAFSSLGDSKQAENEQKIFMDSKAKLPLSTLYGYNKASDVLAVAECQLDSKIAEMNGDNTAAINLLRKAVSLQDELYYNEPPDWYFPIRENLGELYYKNEQYPIAELIFTKDLEKHPLNGRSLFGLWKTLEAQSKTTDAYWIKSAFHKAWKYADTPLSFANPELKKTEN